MYSSARAGSQIQATCSIVLELRMRKINPTSLTPCNRTAHAEDWNFFLAVPGGVEASERPKVPPPSEMDTPLIVRPPRNRACSSPDEHILHATAAIPISFLSATFIPTC